MKLSVNIVTRGRLAAFKRCCHSVANALPQDSEVLVLVNGTDPGAKAFLEQFSHPAFRWQSITSSSLAQARNIAWELSRGEILYCIDDDVEVPKHLFHSILAHFNESEYAVIGGPNLTPPYSRFWPTVFGAVMQNAFIAPFICRRYGAPLSHKRPVGEFDLMFCNLAIHTRRTPTGLRFQNHLRSNEENTFVTQVREQNLSCKFDSELYVYHQRRETLFGFLKQINSYGYGRAQQMLMGWRTSYWPFLVPTISLLMGLFLLIKGPGLLCGLIALHGLLALGFSIPVRKRLQLNWWQVLVMLPVGGLVHLAYGIGLLKKIIESLVVATRARKVAFLFPAFSWREATKS